jgi:hypothetical protein
VYSTRKATLTNAMQSREGERWVDDGFATCTCIDQCLAAASSSAAITTRYTCFKGISDDFTYVTTYKFSTQTLSHSHGPYHDAATDYRSSHHLQPPLLRCKAPPSSSHCDTRQERRRLSHVTNLCIREGSR